MADVTVTDTLIELADTLVSDYDLLDYLDRLLDRSVVVLGADAGGVMLAGSKPQDGLKVLAATDERARTLELFEVLQEEGPCVDSHRLGAPVIERDLAHTDRWPTFTPMALDNGYRGVYAFPMRLRGQGLGALNLYSRQPGAAEGDIAAAQAFAHMATIGILQHRAVTEARRVAGQLQTALQSRVVIEQAKGLLAERTGCELDEAYQLVRWYARDHNRTLREVAGAVVDGTLSAEELTGQPGDTP